MKKGVSPVIATVLLIVIVLIIAIIILLWARGFFKEAIIKEIAGTSKLVDNWCEDIVLNPIVYNDGSGKFGFKNNANVPIYQYGIKVSNSDGSSEIIEKTGIDGMVNPGMSVIVDGLGPYDSYEKISIIPVLVGNSKTGQKTFECKKEFLLK